jgi:hypothetical protein
MEPLGQNLHSVLGIVQWREDGALGGGQKRTQCHQATCYNFHPQHRLCRGGGAGGRGSMSDGGGTGHSVHKAALEGGLRPDGDMGCWGGAGWSTGVHQWP